MDLKDRLKKIMFEKNKPTPEEQEIIDFKINKLKNSIVPQNTILFVEPHDAHGVIQPSIVKYLLNLGFKVHLIMLESQRKLNVFKRCKFINSEFQITYFPKIPTTQEFFDIFHNYSYILIGTLLTHMGYDFVLNLEEKYIKKYNKSNVYCIGHDICLSQTIDTIEKRFLENEKTFVLRDNLKWNNKELPFVSTTYFGEFQTTLKNDNITKFLMIGGGNKKNLRNFEQLFNAIDMLIDNKYNFEVTLIGITPDRLEGYLTDKNLKYVRNLGKLDFEDMYREIEQGDYILFGIDKTCVDYEKYTKGGITGSYLLSLAFIKPGIMDKNLAISYDLEDKSLTYNQDNHNALYETMIKAIKLNNSEYQNLQGKLTDKKKQLENKSLNNLKKVFVNDEIELCFK